MSNFRVSYDAAAQITSYFRDAQDELEASAPSMPGSVDGGDGADFIMSMIAQVGEDAGTLAQAADFGATNMKEAVDLIQGCDDEVAETFRKTAAEMVREM